MASISTDPMACGADFLIQPTATYLTTSLIELVFDLISEKVGPASIAAYLASKCPGGSSITKEDVLAVRDGNFHVSGRQFYYRISTTGSIVRNDLIDDYFQNLATIGPLPRMRTYIEDNHSVILHDDDLLDIYNGLFRVVGPHTASLTSRANRVKYFVPRSVSSEAMWMVSQGWTKNFVSKYILRRYGCIFPVSEIARLETYAGADSAEDAAHEAIITRALRVRTTAPAFVKYSNCRRPASVITTGIIPKMGIDAIHVHGGTYTANPFIQTHNEDGTYAPVPVPNCLKRTSHRAPPPSPIITTCAAPKIGVQAVQLRGKTFTANPFVRRHKDDGSYELVKGSEANRSTDNVSSSSTSSCSRIGGSSSPREGWSTAFSYRGSSSPLTITSPLPHVFNFNAAVTGLPASPGIAVSYQTRLSPLPSWRKRRASINSSVWYHTNKQ